MNQDVMLLDVIFILDTFNANIKLNENCGFFGTVVTDIKKKY
jgi:hypothetical protein